VVYRTSWGNSILGESDINAYLRHTGDGWNTYTPILAQGSTVVSTDIVFGGFWRSGRLCVCNIAVRASSAGRSDQPIRLQLPFDVDLDSGYQTGQVLGSGHFYDFSADAGNSGGYVGWAVIEERSNNYVELWGVNAGNDGKAIGLPGSVTSVALAALDWVGIQVQFETGVSA
jgi:hypothetical protein